MRRTRAVVYDDLPKPASDARARVRLAGLARLCREWGGDLISAPSDKLRRLVLSLPDTERFSIAVLKDRVGDRIRSEFVVSTQPGGRARIERPDTIVNFGIAYDSGLVLLADTWRADDLHQRVHCAGHEAFHVFAEADFLAAEERVHTAWQLRVYDVLDGYPDPDPSAGPLSVRADLLQPLAHHDRHVAILDGAIAPGEDERGVRLGAVIGEHEVPPFGAVRADQVEHDATGLEIDGSIDQRPAGNRRGVLVDGEVEALRRVDAARIDGGEHSPPAGDRRGARIGGSVRT